MESRFFAGPQVEKSLETVTPGLELVKDYGVLTILAKPLYWLLDKLHSYIGNWGWAIIALGFVAENRFLLAQRQSLFQHGQDEVGRTAHRHHARALERQAARNAARDDENLPRRENQPSGRLLPHHGANSGVYRLVLGLAQLGRDAQCPVGAVDSRLGRTRSVLHLAIGHDPDHALANRVEPNAARPIASQNDVVHAAGLLRHVLLLPVGLGVVLDHQQHLVHRPAVAHQHPHGRAAAVQLAEIQIIRDKHPQKRPH